MKNAFIIFLLFIAVLGFNVKAEKLPQAMPGKLVRHIVWSPQLQQKVPIDVWLPSGYDAASSHHYPVIYMHDGQNLFDPSTTWNHQAWEMDSVATSEAAFGRISVPIIVGVHSFQETRVPDLFPRKAFKYIKGASQDSIEWTGKMMPLRGDDYAAFIVETVKPIIDRDYKTYTDPRHTFVMGSSMGGLMSLYMMCEYPKVFGGAACLSTHWIGKHPEGVFPNAMKKYLEKNLPRDKRHRLYFDHGTTTADAQYGIWEDMMLKYIQSQGYQKPYTLMNHVEYGAAHNENWWKWRVHLPLRFLLPAFR